MNINFYCSICLCVVTNDMSQFLPAREQMHTMGKENGDTNGGKVTLVRGDVGIFDV